MIKKILLLLSVSLVFILIAGCRQAATASSAEIMYFVLIDRFADGDTSNNSGQTPGSYLAYEGTNPEALKHYQGGDLSGITQNLDSLQSMGITMIWISPFLDNSNSDYVGWWAYHGYHPIDFFSVDEHFGTLDDLKLLVNSAHARGMKIIFDMPFNQTAADHPWIDDPEKTDWYHWDEQGKPFEITDWFDQEQIEIGELHGLPDLAQENDAVYQYLMDVSKYWIDETGCDGFRLDAVKHIPVEFWERYVRDVREIAGSDFLLMGEVFWGEAFRIKPYADIGFDYLFDIPGYYAIQRTFNKGAPIKNFSDFYQENATDLASTRFATLIDNHDVARFNAGLAEQSWDKQKLALGWLMTAPGLPVIYSGTEIGMDGYPVKDANGIPQDFLNRLPLPTTLNSEQLKRKMEFSELTQLRHTYPALSQGSFHEVYKDWSIYAYLRSVGEDQLLICLNNASTEEFVSLPKPPGIESFEPQPVYGVGVLREEGNEFYLRLPGNSMTVWALRGRADSILPTWVDFTDRLSRDYQQITLYYLDPEGSVDKLEVAGDFNNWLAEEYSNHKQGDTLFTTIPVKPGSYTYKFVLNGSDWIANPHASEFSQDPYGGKNSILNVLDHH